MLSNTPVKLLAIFIFILTLSSCGGGGGSNSSNSSTTGSTQFYATNNDKVNYARVDIEDNSGNIQSSTPIYCPAQSGCSFKANMPAAGSLLFYDKNNTMVNAYILTYAPSDTQFVSTSLEMLGIYLLSSYDNQTSEDIVVDYAELASFFANYTSTDPNLGTNYLTLMAKYYQLQTIGTGLSYADFNTNLNKSLLSGSVLPANQLVSGITDYFTQFLALFKTRPLIASAYAANPSTDNVSWSPCSSVFTGNLPKGLGASAKLLELGAKSTFFTGMVFDAASTLWGDACKAPDKNMLAINEKLNLIKTDIETLLAKTENGLNYLTTATLDNQLEGMNKNLDILKDVTTAYKTLKDASPNGDLTQYISNQGGLEKAWNSSDNLKKIFNLTKIWNAASAVLISNNKDLFNEGLKARCGLQKSASDDLAIARSKCNILIKRYQALAAGAGFQAQVLLRDVTAVLSQYSTAESDFITRNITPPNSWLPDTLPTGSKDWGNYFTNKLEKPLKEGMDASQFGFAEKIETITDGTPYFDVYGDIPTDLRTSLINAGCVNPDNNGALNIQRWIRNDSNSYVNVRCKKDGTYYNSKYLYSRDGNNVRNVLGVIVSQNLIGSTRGIDQAAFDTSELASLRLIIDKAQNLSYADNNGNSLSLSYGNDDIAIVGYNADKLPNGSGTAFFSFTDRTPQKNSWIFRLNKPLGTLDLGKIILDCYITNACGLGAQNNAIGFGAWGGPDPVIVNIQPNPKGSIGTTNLYYYFTIKLPTDDPKITTKLANY